MLSFSLFENDKIANFIIENESFDGIKMIGKTIEEDMESVTGKRPVTAAGASDELGENLVLMATLGKSPLLDKLISDGKISLSDIEGKREVYKITVVETPFAEYENIKKLLVIAGSDKRGTIYGMFRLSEMCGVSPLVFWGDAVPQKKDKVVLEFETDVVSKEPSVKYRGFFINDEWPAFGNWCVEHYGDVNAKAYEKIFELLLRMKGNYLWPAMWSSIFSEDGPGTANAELADKLGVIMGTSHHEPLCRAGEEWQRQYKKYSDDNTWSFLTNEEGIRKFWEDGVIRNKDFENVITVGMRGEADSKLLPEDATLKDNIDVVKKAIKAQHEILEKQMDADLKDVPRMLAIYKEVEDYYYGDEQTEGLKDWDELRDVIFLLSDDNHGYVRALPTKEEAKHPGGFGMYYHFDYHGAPVSYEWINCNRLTKTWEQMGLAYEAGVRQMWIVNVGDLKLNEYPLSFFMDMAYDYEGHKAVNKTAAYLRSFIDKQFGDAITAEQKDGIFQVLEGYTRWNSTRTPETMSEKVYNPVDFMEGDRVREEISRTYELANRLNEELAEPALTTYRSLVYYPAAASLNVMLMNIEAGMNNELARRGCVYANHYRKSVINRIKEDKKLVADFHAFNGGKWNHMMSSAHTGFRSWDAYNWSYPLVAEVSSIHEAKAVVSFRGSRAFDLGSHWQGSPILKNDAFTRPEIERVLLDIDSRGDIAFSYKVETDSEWLSCEESEGRVEISDCDDALEGRKTVVFRANRNAIHGKATAKAKVKLSFDNGAVSESSLEFEADDLSGYKKDNAFAGTKNLFVDQQGLIVMNADNFCEKKDLDGAGFEAIEYLGKAGRTAIKAFPVTEAYDEDKIKSGDAPSVTYNFVAKESGEYVLDFHCAMRNPIVRGGRLSFGYSVNDEDIKVAHEVSEGYFTEWQCDEWGRGVLNHEHVTSEKIKLSKGLNTLTVYAGDPNVVLEKLVLHEENVKLPESYLGPEQSIMMTF